MRFSVIHLASLLLLPSLVISKQYVPPTTSSPRLNPPHPIPDHGDIVRFQGDHGPHLGVVVGSQQHQGHNVNLNIAPSVSNSRHPSEDFRVHHNELVSTRPGNVAKTRHRAVGIASNLQTWHQIRPPNVDSASGAVRGSPNHPGAQVARGGHGR